MDELAEEHKFSYEVVTADIDEKAIREPKPEDLVIKLAHAKADAIIAKLQANGSTPTGFLITCDQVVTHEGRILEKPNDAEEARRFIDGYGRAPASTVGSTVCTNLSNSTRYQQIDIAEIHFNHIPSGTAEILIKEGDVMWCAGGLMVEHPLVQPHVTKMIGGIDSVMGLSKQTTVDLLLKASSASSL